MAGAAASAAIVAFTCCLPSAQVESSPVLALRLLALMMFHWPKRFWQSGLVSCLACDPGKTRSQQSTGK
jgi:hypothetical protein